MYLLFLRKRSIKTFISTTLAMSKHLSESWAYVCHNISYIDILNYSSNIQVVCLLCVCICVMGINAPPFLYNSPNPISYWNGRVVFFTENSDNCSQNWELVRLGKAILRHFIVKMNTFQDCVDHNQSALLSQHSEIALQKHFSMQCSMLLKTSVENHVFARSLIINKKNYPWINLNVTFKKFNHLCKSSKYTAAISYSLMKLQPVQLGTFICFLE